MGKSKKSGIIYDWDSNNSSALTRVLKKMTLNKNLSRDNRTKLTLKNMTINYNPLKPKSLSNTLRLAVQSKQPMNVIELLIDQLQALEHLDLSSAISVFESLCLSENFGSKHGELLQKIYRIFEINDQYLTTNYVILILSLMSHKVYVKRMEKFKDWQIIYKLKRKVFQVIRDCPASGLTLLQSFTIMKFQHRTSLLRINYIFWQKFLHNKLSYKQKLVYYTTIIQSCIYMKYEIPKEEFDVSIYNSLLSTTKNIALLDLLIHVLIYESSISKSSQDDIHEDKVEKLLCQIMENFDEIPVPQALMIFVTLSHKNLYVRDQYLPMLSKVYKVLTEKYAEIPPRQFPYFIKHMKPMVAEKHRPEFYDGNFVDSLISHAMDKKIDFEDLMLLMKYIVRLRHKDIKLLDYVSKKLVSEDVQKTLTYEKRMLYIKIILKSCLAFDHKPPEWKEIMALINVNEHLAECNYMSLVSVLSLIYFGEFNTQLIDQLLRNTEYHDCKMVSLASYSIWQILLGNPHYKGPLLAIDKINAMAKKLCYVQPFLPLDSILERISGGKIYIKSRLYTKAHNLITHVLCYRPGGLPVPINAHKEDNQNEINYIEDIKVPPKSLTILIKCLPQNCFFRNTKELLCLNVLDNKRIENKCSSWKVLALNHHEISYMTEIEGTLHVAEKIRSVLQNNDFL